MRNQQRDWLVHQRGLHIVTQGSFEQTMSLVLLLFVSFLSLADHGATESAELKPCGLPVLGRSSSANWTNRFCLLWIPKIAFQEQSHGLVVEQGDTHLHVEVG